MGTAPFGRFCDTSFAVRVGQGRLESVGCLTGNYFLHPKLPTFRIFPDYFVARVI